MDLDPQRPFSKQVFFNGSTDGQQPSCDDVDQLVFSFGIYDNIFLEKLQMVSMHAKPFRRNMASPPVHTLRNISCQPDPPMIKIGLLLFEAQVYYPAENL